MKASQHCVPKRRSYYVREPLQQARAARRKAALTSGTASIVNPVPLMEGATAGCSAARRGATLWSTDCTVHSTVWVHYLLGGGWVRGFGISSHDQC